MVLVCLSHFTGVYFRAEGKDAAVESIQLVTMIASPTFMLLSGVMVGFLHEVRGPAFARTARAFVGRGLFLLTVGHALILISLIPRLGFDVAITHGFITDVIGIGIIEGPFLVQHAEIRERLLLAAALLFLGTLLVVGWTPANGIEGAARYVLVGPQPSQNIYNFPVLPWVAVHIVGTGVGTGLARSMRDNPTSRPETHLLRIGLAGLAFATVVKLGYWVARGTHVIEPDSSIAYILTSPIEKLPPSLPYFALYGGIGLIMTAALLLTDRRRRLNRLVSALALLGRTSLFVFLLQYYVYYVILYYLDLPYHLIWPIYFLATLGLIYGCAKVWEGRGYNRHLNMLDWFPGRVVAASALSPILEPAPRRLDGRSDPLS